MTTSTAQAQAAVTDHETAAKAAQAQQAAEWRLSFRPSLSVVRQTVSQLRTLPRVTSGERDAADELMKQAAQQSEADARRTLWRAAATLLGRGWTTEQELMGSLALLSATPISTGGDLLAAFLFSMSFGVAMSTMADEYDTVEVRKAAINVHTRIADAIEAQNDDLAFRRMEKHVSATRAVTSAREDREIGT